ncbi:hypothetical protein [Winogradskyella forsetii]|nr:hypothetical protein [Winogradskyella forsetii]
MNKSQNQPKHGTPLNARIGKTRTSFRSTNRKEAVLNPYSKSNTGS